MDRRSNPPKLTYKLIPATSSDRDWLDSLRRDAYQDLFRATWGGWDETRHARHFAECIARGNIFIIEVGANRVGMIQVFHQPDAVEVGEIQVTLAHQNKGVGSRVLRDIISEAHRCRKTVRLSLGLKNVNALRLYERLGFRRAARSETHVHMECEP